MPISQDVVMRVQADWAPFMKQINLMFEQISDAIKKAFPFLVRANEAHRREVKRVHTMYRQKQGRRRRGRRIR